MESAPAQGLILCFVKVVKYLHIWFCYYHTRSISVVVASSTFSSSFGIGIVIVQLELLLNVYLVLVNDFYFYI